MTGYGSASTAAANVADPAANSEGNGAHEGPPLAVEVRSVNGRFLDVGFRLPEEFRQHEGGLRELLVQACRRGKVELRVNLSRQAGEEFPLPSSEQLMRLARVEGTVLAWLPKAPPLSVHETLQWCRGAPAPVAVADEALLGTARRAIAALKEAREREGAKLADMLRERIARLHELAAQAEPLVPAVVSRQQQRFLDRFKEALKAVAGDDPGAASAIAPEALRERALNEAATFALRIDVAEELSRLRSHLGEIARLLDAGGELGKRLDFLIQELHREANTLGSKSAALELTGVSVEMKVLVEQMREQVQNIE